MNITEHNASGVIYLSADGIETAGGAAHGFSTRLGGVSEGIYASLNLGANRGDDPAHVRENYRRFCAAIGTDVERMVFSCQVHGCGVRVVTAADIGKGLGRPVDYEADALITDVPGIALTVFSADCLPILLYDPQRRVAGAVHAVYRFNCGLMDALSGIVPALKQRIGEDARYLDPAHHIGVDLLQRGQVHAAGSVLFGSVSGRLLRRGSHVRRGGGRLHGLRHKRQPPRLAVKLDCPLVPDVTQIEEEQAHRHQHEEQELKKSPWVDTQSRTSLK